MPHIISRDTDRASSADLRTMNSSTTHTSLSLRRLSESIVRWRESSTGFAHPEESLLVIQGSDALGYLNAMSASDLSTLPATCWRAAAFTNAQGRLVAWARVARHEGAIVAVVPGAGTAGVLRDHLLRHRLRSQVEIALREDLVTTYRIQDPRWNPLALSGEIDGEGAVGHSWLPLDLTIGHPREGPSATRDPHADAVLRFSEIEAGLVRLPGRLSGLFTLPALGPHLISLVSLTKGCFPGQEVVRKMLRGGRGHRFLAWGIANAPVTGGVDLLDREGRVRATVLDSLVVDTDVVLQVVVERPDGNVSDIELLDPTGATRCYLVAIHGPTSA